MTLPLDGIDPPISRGTITAAEIRRRIRVRYGKTTEMVRVPEHVVMFEVPVDSYETKADRYGPLIGSETVRDRWAERPGWRRRIDAVAVGLWRSSDYLIHGFEIKTSRADLLAELRQPAKSEAGWRRCDRWWLTLSSKDLLRPADVIPDGWGVLVCRGRGLGVLRESGQMPGDRDGRFLAGLMQASLRSHGACRNLGYVDGFLAAQQQFARHIR